jgi:DNA-binding NarL/FixJ family response regulator
MLGALAGRGSSRVLVLSEFADGARVTDALRAGAYGCVTDHAEDDELLRAVETVAGGGFHISPVLASRLRAEIRLPRVAAAPPILGRRETETLRWLASGLTHGEIARRMGLTETTVSTYVKRIRIKLDVRNKAELTRIAIELGLLDTDADTAVQPRRALPAWQAS